MKQMKNLIIDLDNTIYPVKSIGDKLFAPLLKLLKSPEYGLKRSIIAQAREQIMRVPFQKVAAQFNFPANLTQKATELLRGLTYDEEMNCFEEYTSIRELHTMKFLLTSGFTKLQESKIHSLNIEGDFTEIFVIDPDISKRTKKDAMMEIMEKYDLLPESLLVVGDDPESEIRAAKELGIATFLLDTKNAYPDAVADYKGGSLQEVLDYII
jgi:putative hydrolase of the HAD superfamily